MLASLALISMLQAPAVGAGDLSLTNVRFSVGLLGPARTNLKFRPGDSVFLSFDVQGITADASGKANYTTTVEVLDPKGKSLVKQESRPLQEFLPLGGDVLPAFAHVDVGFEFPPGEYTMKFTVTDNSSSKTARVSEKFEVLPKGFDLVRLNATGDFQGTVPTGAFCVGQPFFFHAAVVGFERSSETKQPKVSLALKVLDEGGKPIVGKPFTGLIDKDVPASDVSLPVRFFVPLNKAGRYVIEVVATDELKNIAVSKKFPITVLPTNK